MEKEALEHWINSRLKGISKQASSIKPGFFPERIHEFRTETKKLRAMMRLLGMESGDEPSLPKHFHKAYKAAGVVRDRQMELQFLACNKRHTLPFFAIWLANQTGKASKDWNGAFSASVLNELDDYVAGLSMPPPELKTLGRYLRERQDKIRELMETDPKDEALHEIRKLSKDMGYMVGMCKKIWPEAWTFVQPLEKALGQLSDKAGAYNDRRNLVDGLEQFLLDYTTELDRAMQENIARAGRDWASSKERERTALLSAIRQFVNRKISG